MGNLGYGIIITVTLAFVIGFIVYVAHRSEECTARGGTLVRPSMTFLTWECVLRAPR